MMTEALSTTDIDVDRAITLTDCLVREYTGRHLSDIQIAVLRETWLGGRKTYSQLAKETQYSASYVQQYVGPKLWQLLSQITGDKITKKTARVSLCQYFASNASVKPLESSKSDSPKSDSSKSGSSKSGSSKSDSPNPNVPDPVTTLVNLELPEDSVPLQSPFYIEQGVNEYLCYQEIQRPGCLIRIKAPRQMGKSSLVNRILAQAQTSGLQIALLNFQQAENAILSDINRLLRWVCANLAVQLGSSTDLDQYWDADLGSKMSCNLFLQSHILSQLKTQLVIAFEEVNELLAYPHVAQEFLTLLRFWHERSKLDQRWNLLRLVMVHSTEIYVSLDVNQSPLNVGLSINLPPFNHDQIRQLVERHHLTLSDEEITQLNQVVGGHPHLIRLALYSLAKDNLTVDQILDNAATDVSIFYTHLHKSLFYLNQFPELEKAFVTVLKTAKPVDIDQIDAFKLQSLGLVRLSRDGATVSCELYQQYFREHFRIENCL